MLAKLYDKFLLALSIMAVTPFLILALLIVVVGYPLHLIKKIIFS